MTKLCRRILLIILGLVIGVLSSTDVNHLNDCSYHQYHSCDSDATCKQDNSDPPNWSCICNAPLVGDGLKGENNTGCGPMQCNDDNECHPLAFCNVNAVCECNVGYAGNGRTECIDENECNVYPCHEHARCENTPGSFTCTCKMEENYVGNGFNCSHVCAVDYDCGNVTKHKCVADVCVCRTGYKQGPSECIDIDECQLNDVCDINADCHNTDGSYLCTCRNGYEGDGKECTAYFRNCHDMLLAKPKAVSGRYWIDSDFTGPLPAVEVTCEMRPGLGITIISPQVKNGYRLYNWRTSITYLYEIDILSIKAIISTSAWCYQEMRYWCFSGAALMDGNDYWLNGDLVHEENWSGATSTGKCACGELGYCDHGSTTCNCDGGSSQTLTDHGRVLDKEKLPIRGIVSVPGKGSAVVQVKDLHCAPKPFDIPTSCHEAKFKNGIMNDGPQVVDFDGPDGPLLPVLVHCDMQTYPHAGVTVIPHNFNTHLSPESPGNHTIHYAVGIEHIRQLLEISTFCSQEAEYECTNSRLLNNGEMKGYFSGVDGNVMTYWPGGMQEANKCGCAITGACESADYGCNCDIVDGVTRKDFGLVTEKDDLPLGSVTLMDIGGTSKGTLRLGPLRCSGREFGILATCQSYLDQGQTYNYTYLIDPDGPSKENEHDNQPPFPVYCEMTGNPMYAVTIVYHQYEDQITVTSAGTYAYAYVRVSMLQLAGLIERAITCTQTVKYTCRNAALHVGSNSTVKWLSRDGSFHSYFAGDGNKAMACSCGLPEPSHCEGGGNCECDIADGTERTDEGVLVKKNDLPVLQLVFSDMTGEADLKVGPLMCQDLFPNCADLRVFSNQFRLESELPFPDGQHVIDPDGALGVQPFLVTCSGTLTLVPSTTDPDTTVDGLPNTGISKCYNVEYQSNGYPISPAQIQALVENSKFCAQSLSLQCQNAPLSGHTNYTTCDGVTQTGWAGSKGQDKCACGVTGSCVGGPETKCNCDLEDGVLREDGAWLLDKNRMAVCEVCVSLDSANSVTSEPKLRRAKPVVSDLYCDRVPIDQTTNCQDVRDVGETKSGTRMVDPDGSGPVEPFPVNCIIQSYPPMGWTEIYPKKPEVHVPNDGIDHIVEYYAFTIEYLVSLIKKAGYCTQELLLECNNSHIQLDGTFGWYSRDGVIQRTWSGGCSGANCTCNLGGIQIDGGVIRDTALLPIMRVVLGPASGSRTLKIGPVKCFDLYKDCEDIRVNNARSNPFNNETYAIDPDGSGEVPPFAVTCDFKTASYLGITIVPVILPTNKGVTGAFGPGSFQVTVKYDGATYTQIHALAARSIYCHQGLHYMCSKSPLTNFVTPAQSFYYTYDGTQSPSFGAAYHSYTPGCSCVLTKTCPAGHRCHCDAIGRMTMDYGSETNRTVLPITKLNFGGQTNVSSGMYGLSNVRCSVRPFDLPADCSDVRKRGLMTGEHLIMPSTAVEPFVVYCDMGLADNDGVTIIGNDRESGTTVVYDSTIRVVYHNANNAQVTALISASKYCYQPIIYRCRYTKMLAGQGYFYWKGSSSGTQKYFGYGRTFARECNCGRDGLCGGSEDKATLSALLRACNCDAADAEPRADGGIFNTKSRLPVREMFFKTTGVSGASGHVTLGKLYCSDSPFDLDECSLGFYDCHPKARCINTELSYDCQCLPGWRGYGRPNVWANGRNCYDDDECAMHFCPWSADCTNLPGSYNCTCKKGFLQTGKRQCDDIDECVEGTHNCHANATCINTAGGFYCRCNRNFRGDGVTCEPLAQCACFGDPHCITSDGRLVDYQGLCQYVMSRDKCDELGSPPTYEVFTTHFRRPNLVAREDAAWVKEVTFNYGGYSVLLMQGNEIRVNGVTINTPFRRATINIQRYSNNVIVITNIGVEIRWSAGQNVEVFTPGQFANKTCGLCGNYNGNPDDDLTVGPECQEKAGNQTENSNVFGNSWVVPAYIIDHPECEANCTEEPESGICTGLEQAKAKYACDKIFSTHEQFKTCLHEMNDVIEKMFYHACLYDICRLQGDIEVGICDVADSLAKTCARDYNVTVKFRQKDFCDIDCGENMVFGYCIDNNPVTCMDYLKGQDPPTLDDNTCQDGCSCEEGFIMDEGKCVQPDDCGCIYEDMYYEIDEELIVSNCNQRLTCQANHTMTMDGIVCHENATCALKHGRYGCHCDEGYYGDGVDICRVDPCGDSPCGENETCIRDFSKTNGYVCECNMGFIGDCGNCTEVDECLTASNSCPLKSNCVNTVASYECVCEPGYTMFAGQCEDVDECKLAEFSGDALCPNNSKCVNTIGSFECPCCAGYEEGANGTCKETAGSSYGGPKCCVCNIAACDNPGKVCGEDGVTYDSIKDMVISNCEKGLSPSQYIQVDYKGKCQGSCSNVACPKYQHCEINDKTGKPTCVCDPCTETETQSTEPVCTDKLDVYPNYCVFKKVQCMVDAEAEVLPDEVPCEGKGGASPVGPWSPWGPCSVTCGKGVTTRTRPGYTAEAHETYVLSSSTDCYEDPCPGTACFEPGACENIAAECVVVDNETVCECPTCENIGLQPVCGFVEGVAFGMPVTWSSACKLQKTACENDADDFEVMHEGACGQKPLNCTRVPFANYIRGGENNEYVSADPVHQYECDGGCGHLKEFCCQPSKFETTVVTLHKNTPPASFIYTEVHIIKECECVDLRVP